MNAQRLAEQQAAFISPIAWHGMKQSSMSQLNLLSEARASATCAALCRENFKIRLIALWPDAYVCLYLHTRGKVCKLE